MEITPQIAPKSFLAQQRFHEHLFGQQGFTIQDSTVQRTATPPSVPSAQAEIEDTILGGLPIRELDGYLLRRSQGLSPTKAMLGIADFKRGFLHVQELDSYLAYLIQAQTSDR